MLCLHAGSRRVQRRVCRRRLGFASLFCGVPRVSVQCSAFIVCRSSNLNIRDEEIVQIKGFLLAMSDKTLGALQKIRRVADYQFGRGAGELFPDGVVITFSKKTRKIRHIYFGGELLATLRPSDGLFSLTIGGAERLMEAVKSRLLWVRVQEETASFAEGGHDVFAKHVVDADEAILPGEEVAVVNGDGEVIAVGRAVLSGKEMKAFRRGVAVKVRRGNAEKIKKGKDASR